MNPKGNQQDEEQQGRVRNDWSKQVNLSIFLMIVVDTWKVYSQFSYNPQKQSTETQKEFYGWLVAELIDNQVNQVGEAWKTQNKAMNKGYNFAMDHTTRTGCSGIDAHITPTKRNKKSAGGRQLAYALQGRC
jgi:hypothetical protein